MTTRPASRLPALALLVLRVVVALAFAAAAVLKLSGNPRMVAEFGTIGLGQWFRVVTGVIELAGAVLLVVPRTTLLGALVLIGICGGALGAQLAVLHGGLAHVFVLGGLLGVIAYLARPGRE